MITVNCNINGLFVSFMVRLGLYRLYQSILMTSTDVQCEWYLGNPSGRIIYGIRALIQGVWCCIMENRFFRVINLTFD